MSPNISPLTVVLTMAKRGMLAPILPHRLAGQLTSLLTWGMSLAGEVRQASIASPGTVAIIDQSRGRVTYAELWQRSIRNATALREWGAQPGDRIGLLARNHVGAVEAMIGAAALGVDLVLANTGSSADQLAVIAEEQGLKLLVHDDEFAPLVAGLPDSVHRFSASELEELVEDQPVVPEPPKPEHAGRTIILTSGTTGTPKGAARKEPGGISPLISMIDRIPINVADTILVSAPIFHTWGYAALQLAFGMRATVVLRERFNPVDAVAALEKHKCTGMFAVPVMLQRILEQVPPDPSGRPHKASLRKLRLIATSGSAFPAGFTTRFMDEYGDVLYNLYGSTEASWVCIATPKDLRRRPDTAGTPPLGTVVKILDDEGAEVAPGESGRIFAGNDLVFEGYTSGASKEFIDGLVSTGDLGHVEDGLLFIDGRADDMIVSGGENVYPREVESLLEEHPAVREVAVVGVPDAEFGQRLAAFVALRPKGKLSAKQVQDHVRAHRARHCVPREVVFLDELPRNASGKVLAKDLRAQFE